LDHEGMVYDLHYHMDYPATDPMNQNNPTPPSSRAFTNNVPLVPYAVLNGGVSSEYRFDLTLPMEEIDEGLLQSASEELPSFELELTVDFLETRMEGNARIICLDDSFDSALRLYIVVIEKEVASYSGLNQGIPFRNVVLDMVPSVSGILLGDSWSVGLSVDNGFQWDYPGYVEDTGDLCVVAFIQNPDNKWILQADEVSCQ